MSTVKILTAEDCKNLEPRMFVVNHGEGECLSENVCKWLEPIDKSSIKCWYTGKENHTSLHYHNFDEYWLWNKGSTELTIRLPDGRSDTFNIEPGWIVYCVRGIEHGHIPVDDWGCFEFRSVLREGIKVEHLYRGFE